MRRWGPLNSVAEFAGERLIGVLQKIPTNTRLSKSFFVSPYAVQALILLFLGQMDGTMMAWFSEWQRLLSDHPIIEEIVHPVTTRKRKEPEQSQLRIQLGQGDYKKLLAHVQNGKDNVRDYC